MSNFWAGALGVTPPVATPAAPARPVVGGYAPSPYFTPAQPQNAPSEAPEASEGPQVPGQWGDVTVARQKAQSAKLTDVCPECGSGNYFAPKGMPNYMPQCYECGYNPRFAQMTAGGGLPSDSSAPSRPARQHNPKGVSQYHPEMIIDPASGQAMSRKG